MSEREREKKREGGIHALERKELRPARDAGRVIYPKKPAQDTPLAPVCVCVCVCVCVSRVYVCVCVRER